jgi:hypothetical protein
MLFIPGHVGKSYPFAAQRQQHQLNNNKRLILTGQCACSFCSHFPLLNVNIPGRSIGREYPVAWPPRSPGLTPLDFFFLWACVKDQVYSEYAG